MDFFESLFDFNGDGKYDWLDDLDEFVVTQIINGEDEEKQPDDDAW